MKGNTFLSIIVACSFLLNAGVIGVWIHHLIVSQVYEPPKSSPVHGRCGICPFHRSIQLTEYQLKKIGPQLSEFQKSAQEICADISNARLALLDELAKPESDTLVLSIIRARITEEQRKMQQLNIKHLLYQKSILTPEQNAVFFTTLRNNMECQNNVSNSKEQ